MKLTTWSATAHGRALIVEGTDEDGMHVELTDVAKIENDWRTSRTVAVRKDGEKVDLS